MVGRQQRVIAISVLLAAAGCPPANQGQSAGGGVGQPSGSQDAGLPTLKPDPKGQSPMLIPDGWTVSSQSQGGVAMMSITETAGARDSPTLGMIASPASPQVTAQSALQQVASNVQNGQVVSTRSLPNGASLIVVQGTVSGVPAKLAATAASDGQRVFAAFFAAPAARFDALGGERLLLAALQIDPNRQPTVSPRPAPTAGNGGHWNQPAAGGNVDIMSYQGQLAMLKNRRPVAPKLLVGDWSQGAGVPTGDVYRDVTTGARSYDSIGHGSFLRFLPNGGYVYLYNYAHNYGACRNRIQRVEEGSYQFDGSTLKLMPREFSGKLCACCAGKMTNVGPKKGMPRIYEVGMHPAGRHMVIRGTCPEYVTSCVGPDGQKFLREGFAKR